EHDRDGAEHDRHDDERGLLLHAPDEQEEFRQQRGREREEERGSHAGRAHSGQHSAPGAAVRQIRNFSRKTAGTAGYAAYMGRRYGSLEPNRKRKEPMTKNELARELADDFELPRRQVTELVEAMLERITQVLRSGDKVQLTPFGQ